MNRVKSVNRVFLATVLLSIAGSFINTWIMGYTDNYFIVLLISQLILIIPSAVYLMSQQVDVAHAIRFRKIRVSNIILIIIFAYLISPLMNLINAISMLYVQNDTTDFMNNIVSRNGFFLSLIMIAFIPCILEESVYRGIFYNEYSKISPLKGIFLSGFLFGIIHGNLNQFSYAFAMGVVFALLIEATNSILATMIVHFVINGTSVVVMAVYPILFKVLEAFYGSDQYNADELIKSMNSGLLDNMNLGTIIRAYGLTALITTALAFVVFRTIAKNSGRWDYIKGIFSKNGVRNTQPEMEYYTEEGDLGLQTTHYEEPVKKRRLITISLIIGIVICVTLMIVNEMYVPEVQEQSGEKFYAIVRIFSFLKFKG
ncbi:CPBP family intramembrane metalloprotease [Anaerocolumna sp. AGMB13025]|uniref:CPBP family intramembrane glutamic endopeptidase n=1 Tax=Anaerocolumna sp. AGMB13025 TaxID=3039116 RepID=UPI00241F4E6C|nr:CPBP family intramembrane glutamic endopeptidase [Anaerocolumna sp. AGMB13025]WFR57823.1 CPBP family intramembrane metalloprotease [Anaerocolumna sp. AGMB13025]